MKALLGLGLGVAAVCLSSCQRAPAAKPPEAPVRAEAEPAPAMLAAPAPKPACTFDASWLDAKALPTAAGADDCSFHQFMWQSFVFLAQAVEGRTRFESWMPTYGIFVDKPTSQPARWGTTPATPCSPATAARDAAGKPVRVYSSITKQAGVDQPLIDHDHNAVYYGISLNDIAYNWVTSCDLYRYGCAAQLADKKAGVDLVKNYPQLAFPNGAVELKTAWKVLTDAEKQLGTFYSVTGQIRPDPKSPHSCKTVTLGLVGMHIVSKTAEHPEFVWATFEHRNNAPDCTALSTSAPLPGGWTFFDKAAYDGCKLPHCTNTYMKESPAIVCREHPWGDPTLGKSPDGANCDVNPGQQICQPDVKRALASNTAAMQTLNTSAAQIIGQSTAFNKVWANYELVGNLWSQEGALPPIREAQAGSLAAANTTMETFVQNGQAGITNPSNCLTCHDMVSDDGTTNLPPAGLSHIFNSLQTSSGGCASGQLPKTCVVN